MPFSHQKVADKSDSTSEHGFIILLRSIGERLDYSLKKLKIVDSAVKEVIECMQSIDEVIDTDKKEHRITQMISGYAKMISSLGYIYSFFGEEKFIKVSKKISEYLNKMHQAFLKENEILDNINLRIYPNDGQLIEMQRLRDLDLFLYFEIYFELLSVQTQLKLDVEEYLMQFGLIDVTIDDVADLREDFLGENYNIFLIKLSENMKSKGYPKINPDELPYYVQKTNVMQKVYSILLPFRKRALRMKSGPTAIREYFINITEKRYSVFSRQFTSS